MFSCAIFGHSEYFYEEYKDKIEKRLAQLIKEYGVTDFYIGMRGNFDLLCLKILQEMKKNYPQVRCIRVWAYMPQGKRDELGFEETVYLLERNVPPLYAIVETNKRMVEKADYILSGVSHDWGGAWNAIEYAKKKGKKIIELMEE